MNLLQVKDKIIPINKEQDDLFICATSFEDRCIRTTELLSPDFRIKDVLIVFYNDILNLSYVRKNTNIINTILEKYTENLYSIRCDFYNTYSLLVELNKEFNKGKLNFQKYKFITIDITCFTTLHLLLLLKYLSQKIKAIFRFIYTEPLIYETIKDKGLSYGLLELATINYKLNHNTINKKGDIYIFLAGHNFDRLYKIFKRLKPRKYWVFLESFGFNTKLEFYRNKISKAFIEEIQSSERFIETSIKDPYLIVESLYKISQKEKDMANLYIIPCGTKLQTLGVFLFSQKITQFNIIVTYPVPLRYEEESSSKGFGKTWMTFWSSRLQFFQKEGHSTGLCLETLTRANYYE